MKKLLLILLIFISLTSFAQMQVKENSFRQIDGFVMLDKNEHYDDNDQPMALIKISTENITAEERRRITFKGNLATYFDVHLEPTEIYLYLSTAATFIEIHHPDYGKTEFTLPYDLKDFAGYEMVLQYVLMGTENEIIKPRNTYLIITSDQDNAVIYIDDKFVGTKEVSKSFDLETSHTWKIECNMYHTESGTVTLNDKTIISKNLRPNFGYISVTSSPENGAKVFVDGNYIGETPCKTDKLKSGSHSVKVMKEMYNSTEKSIVVNDGQTTNANIEMSVNFVNVTINTDADSDIYVDEELKGKGSWTGRLYEGSHYLEARKPSHKTIAKNINLIIGKNETITLEAPKPICGFMDISTTPIMADIYIDGKHYGQTPSVISDLLIGEHELKLEKSGCATLTKTITIKENETLTINEKLQTGKEITISTDQSGDKIYVDGNYVGTSPITSNLSYGSHNIKAERNGKEVSKTISVSQSGGENSVKLVFFGNQTITINGVSFTMIKVEGGTFQMGATSEQGNDAYSAEKPVHSVTLSDYYIGETEVTQELWEAVMGSNPSYFDGNLQRPVETVSWNDCQEFITKLNQLTGKNFRLPTEAEWEYAARGGNKSKGYKYSGSNTIDNVAWCDDDNSNSRTHDVKTKSPNELGIYDMSGNVYEWCQDWYGNYSSGSQTNPKGPSSGSGRVMRGGSWHYYAQICRVSYRSSHYHNFRDSIIGFRLAL